MPANDQTDRPESVDARSDLPRIAGYRLVRRLGLGGMATVYLAVQESLDREVAIKVMRPTRQLDEEQTVRFEHEAAAGHGWNLYPIDRTVWMWRGSDGSSSIFSRSQRTWTSTVRVSPG